MIAYYFVFNFKDIEKYLKSYSRRKDSNTYIFVKSGAYSIQMRALIKIEMFQNHQMYLK